MHGTPSPVIDIVAASVMPTSVTSFCIGILCFFAVSISHLLIVLLPIVSASLILSINLISADKDIMPDALAGLAASAALTISDIPFNGPISEVRVARINGNLMINPTFLELKDADLDIIVGATLENIMMVEGEMSEVSEADMLEAIKFAHEAIKKQCEIQMELAKEVKKTRREYSHETNNEELKNDIATKTYEKAYQVA